MTAPAHNTREHKTRAQLDALLTKLETELPAMAQACEGDQGFDRCVFEGEADAILASAGPADRDYVQEKLQCMAASLGLIPSEHEGESCMSPPRAGSAPD
jgi:hypothetical protein